MRIARSCTAVAIGLLVATGTGTAVAGPPDTSRLVGSCQGRPATIEGDDATLVGTPGNDVIIAGGDVHHVVAGEGDDVVCVVADRRQRVEVLAGPGADLVDTTAATTHTVARLGTGVDTYVGGPELDEVYLDQEVAEPSGVDVVRTGDGFDLVQAESAVDADLGPGDDFYIGEFTEGQGASRVVLGQGHDTLRLDMGIAAHLRAGSRSGQAGLRLDLSTGTLVQDGVQSLVSGAEEVVANGPTVRIQGSRQADDVVSGGCEVTMRGGGGADHLTQVRGYDVHCESRSARLYGQGGADELQASTGNDLLLGGSGRDRADGGGGRDRCVAEKKSACER